MKKYEEAKVILVRIDGDVLTTSGPTSDAKTDNDTDTGGD